MKLFFLIVGCLTCSIAIAFSSHDSVSRLSSELRHLSQKSAPVISSSTPKNEEAVAMIYGGADIVNHFHMVA